jgi:hypothetical protein
MDNNPEILNINVHGLNDPAKCDALREFVSLSKVNLVCIQETKLAVIDSFLVLQCLGPSFDGFVFFLPAIGTRGGVLVAWDSSVLVVSRMSLDSFSINAQVRTL